MNLDQSLEAEARAQSCWALANRYFSASSSLLNPISSENFLPAVFLMLHALELHLKSFLISRGVRERELRRIGHDLISCIRACNERGFEKYVNLSWRQKMQIGRVCMYYKKKELEYFVPKAMSFGSLQQLVGTVDQVGKALFAVISQETFNEIAAKPGESKN